MLGIPMDDFGEGGGVNNSQEMDILQENDELKVCGCQDANNNFPTRLFTFLLVS